MTGPLDPRAIGAVPARIRNAVGDGAAWGILGSRWFDGWLRDLPVDDGPTSPQWDRHVGRLLSLASGGKGGLQAEDAAALKSALVPGAAEEDSAPPPRVFWDDLLAKRLHPGGRTPAPQGTALVGVPSAESEAPQPRGPRYAEPTPEQRGLFLPRVTPRGSTEQEFGWPGILKYPYDAARTLLADEGQYRPGDEDTEGVVLATQAAGAALAGGLANRPNNALASGFARRAGPPEAARRLSQAEALGFDTQRPLYHGTNRSFRKFDLDRAPDQERAVWLTPDREAAGYFGQHRSDGRWDRTRTLPLYARSGKQKTITVEQLETRYGPEFKARAKADPTWEGALSDPDGSILYNPDVWARELELARREGYDSVRFRQVDEGMGAPADQIAVFDPVNVRSTNARFNPRYRNSSNLLSGNPLPAALPALLPREDQHAD